MAIKPEIVFESHAETQYQYIARGGIAIVYDVAGTDVQRQKSLLEEVRSLYWTTDISATEIRDAYLPGRPVNNVPMVAGYVWLGRYCAALIPEHGDEVCGYPLFASSRGVLNDDRRYRCERCPACVQKHRWTPAERKDHAKWDAEYLAKYPPPPQPAAAGLSYQEYLQTDHWQATRTAALKRAGFSCQVCSSKGELHVHHRTYARRGRELDSDLIVLCAGCHGIFHTNGKLADGGRAL